MNETNDPLEAELASFRPRELSPAFQRRIAGRLADTVPGASRRPCEDRTRLRPGRRLPGRGPPRAVGRPGC